MGTCDQLGTLPAAKPDSDPARLAALLAETGIVVMPGWLDTDTVRAVSREVKDLLAGRLAAAKDIGYSTGQGVRTVRDGLTPDFPELARAFSERWMDDVARGHFDGLPYAFNHDVIAVRDIVGTEHEARVPHYDRTPNLKFFAYLTDTRVENGAFCCVPGSQGFAKRVQAGNRAARTLPAQSDTRILPNELVRGMVPVEAPAGTLLIIDSDIVHKGASVLSGERLAVRSRSYDPAYS